MGKAPIVSVIVPIYKVENYLKSCIDSVLAQTMKDIEIILVDDGSPDRCGDICEEYALKDDRIIVIHQKNQGLSAARNSGISIAKGEYFVFVDSDDIIQDTMIERLLNCLTASDAEMSICKIAPFSDNNFNQLRTPNSSQINLRLDKKQAFKSILKRDGLFSYSAWGKMYKRELFNFIRFPVGKIYEDALILSKLLSIVNFIGRVENTCYYYRIRTGSIMLSSFSENDLERISIVDSFSEQAVIHFPELVTYVKNYRINIRIEVARKLLYSDNYMAYQNEYIKLSKGIQSLNKPGIAKNIINTSFLIGNLPKVYLIYSRLRKELSQINLLRKLYEKMRKGNVSWC